MHMCSMFSDRPQKSWNLASLRRLMTNIAQPNSVILLSVRNLIVSQCFIKKWCHHSLGQTLQFPVSNAYDRKVQLFRICLRQDKRSSQALVLKRTLTDAFLMCQGRGTLLLHQIKLCAAKRMRLVREKHTNWLEQIFMIILFWRETFDL